VTAGWADPPGRVDAWDTASPRSSDSRHKYVTAPPPPRPQVHGRSQAVVGVVVRALDSIQAINQASLPRPV
jgi:hypothetical protein